MKAVGSRLASKTAQVRNARDIYKCCIGKDICSEGCLRDFGARKFSCTNSLMYKNINRKEWWKTSLTNVFGKYLLLTNTISSGVLLAIGDLIQQELECLKGDKQSFNWKRCFNMGLVGTIQGPIAHFFYQILDGYLPGIKMSTIVGKILVDQTVASPVFIFLLFGGVNYLANESFDLTKAELKEKFWFVYAVDCSVWIPAQFINFYCLPAKYRVIYINVITMCYNVFLSFVKHTKI